MKFQAFEISYIYNFILLNISLLKFRTHEVTQCSNSDPGSHNNQELWGDPENFRPEPWLNDAEGETQTEFVRREGFLAFSKGKRVCLGEQLARDQLFLFTIALVQAFRVAVDPKSLTPSVDPKLGGSTFSPKAHKLVFTPRT